MSKNANIFAIFRARRLEKMEKKVARFNFFMYFCPMKLQKNYHTTYNVIKGTTFLMLFFLYTHSCYSNDKLPQLEVKQRKGNMLIKLHNNNDTTSRLEKDTFNLPEVTVSGMKRPIKSRISHSMGLPSFMFTENHPKLKIFKDLNMLLSNIGVKRHTDGYGQFHFFAQIMVVDGEGEIDPIPPISISPSDIKQLDFYRTKPTDPDIVVIQLKQN